MSAFAFCNQRSFLRPAARARLGALLGLGLSWMAACGDVDGEFAADVTSALERRTAPASTRTTTTTTSTGPAAPAAGEECTAEASAPSAAAKLALATDAAGASSLRVVAVNNTRTSRPMSLRVDAVIGGRPRTARRPAEVVRAGSRVEFAVSPRELGFDPAQLALPTTVRAMVVVHEEDGSAHERVSAEPLEVGPPLAKALPAVLAEFGVSEEDLIGRDPSGLPTVIAAADLGDHGLSMDELLAPGDPGPPMPEPNYTGAVPDENGMYHYNFCFRWMVDFDDAGFGEDFGVEPNGKWRARGGRLRVMSHGQPLFIGNLDEAGCTGEIESPFHDQFVFTGASSATLGGNDVVVKRWDGSVEAWVRLANEVGGSGVKYYTLPMTNRTNLLAASTFTLASFGAFAGDTYTVNDRCRPDGSQCCDCASGGEIWISRRTRKYLIAHEMGHRILGNQTSYDNDCGLQVSDNHPCFNSSGHAIDSIEHASCAAMEGWAHFVAVRTFNRIDEQANPGAMFRYWRGSGLDVDVEQGPDGGVDRYHEVMCGGPDGQGVELDWLRAYWDYHTDTGAGFAPHQSVMIEDIANNAGWARDTVYQFMTDSIDDTYGQAQLDRWTTIAEANGIDH